MKNEISDADITKALKRLQAYLKLENALMELLLIGIQDLIS